MIVQHLISAVQIRDHQIHIFLIFTTPTVDHSGIINTFIFDEGLHSCQGKLLLLVVAISTHLDSH